MRNCFVLEVEKSTQSPETFLVKDKYQYFKPCIQVEWDEEENRAMIRAACKR